MVEDPAADKSAPLRPRERDEVLLDMATRIGRIEAHTETMVAMASDHEDRIRKVERRIWGVPGSMLVALLAAFGVHVH